jgi:hypothetical protein
MKMSIFRTLAFCAYTTLTACGEERPQAAITFRVVDDFGKPVEGATVAMSTFHHWEPGEGFGKDVTDIFTGETNKEGIVTITGQSLRGEFSYSWRPLPGFYRGGGGKQKFTSSIDGKWQPQNPAIDIVVKRVINPIPMYARKVGEMPNVLRIPEAGKPIGFDLIASDWVAPNGKGKTPDLIFKLERRYTSVEEPFEAKLTVTFSNEGDGIQSVLAAPFVGSDLKLPRHAPEHGYAPELVKRTGRPAANKPIETATREDQNYFFRLRTILDEKKQVKSALYGKLDGDIRFDVINGNPAYLFFTYYLNPEANDRNMEFDVKRNRFGQLPDLQRPSSP